jgi:hypothetical protein
MRYFGFWADPDAAQNKYLDQKGALHSGRKPRPDTEGGTVKELANHFLNAKQAAVDAGELSPPTWACYREACDAVIVAFGKARRVADLDPADFARLRTRLAKRYGRHGLGTQSQCVLCAFMHAFDSGYLARRTMAGWFADPCRVVPGPRGRGAPADHQRQVHRRGRATVCVRRLY